MFCTLGPASDDPEVLRALLRNGTNVIGLNFSHGDHEEHGKRIAMVKQIREEMGLPVAILMDTKGPEIRIGGIQKRESHPGGRTGVCPDHERN